MAPSVTENSIENLSDQLFSSILKKQREINKVLPPKKSRKKKLNDLLKQYKDSRGADFFLKYVSTGNGHGPFTELIDGSVKYNLITSMGLNLLGHSHPLQIRANIEAAAKDVVSIGNLLPYEEGIDFSKSILEVVKDSNLKHFWFTTSGSFANDMALKLIWHKTTPALGVISFENAFSGRTAAVQNMTYNTNYSPKMPSLVDVDFVPFFDQKNPKRSLSRTIKALDKLWGKNPSKYCAINLELIQGEAGFVYGDEEYYREICKWAKNKKLIIWIDEIQTFARNREIFAYKHFNLSKFVDIITFGKALHVSGILYSRKLKQPKGLIGGTIAAPLSSLIFANKALNFLKEGNFYGDKGRLCSIEKSFLSRFKQLSEKNCRGKISYYGGIGTMISFEVGDSSFDLTFKFVKKLFENGIISYYAGRKPCRVRFLLPITLTKSHIDEIFVIIEKTINQIIK